MRLLASFLVFMAAAAHPAGAAESEWSTTFAADRVGSHLDGRLATIIVAAGDAGAERDAAASALGAAVHASGKAEFVLDGRSVGDVAALDDAAIVKKSAALPVKRVLVARVFESPDEAPRAVVTIYDLSGAILGAFAGQRGVPVDAKPGGATQGVGVFASATVAQVTRGGEPSGGQREYDEKYLWFHEVSAVNQYGQVVSSWSTVYRGKYRRNVDSRAFYEIVGRPDLVAKYDAATATQGWMLAGSGVAMLASIPALLFAINPPGFPDRPNLDCSARASGTLSDCFAEENRLEDAWEASRSPAHMAWGITSAALMVLAPVVLAVGIGWNPNPVEPDEARRLADDYNARLRAELGLTDATPPAAAPPKLRFGMAPTDGGAYAALSVEF